jgi:hypothetical protein
VHDLLRMDFPGVQVQLSIGTYNSVARSSSREFPG